MVGVVARLVALEAEDFKAVGEVGAVAFPEPSFSCFNWERKHKLVALLVVSHCAIAIQSGCNWIIGANFRNSVSSRQLESASDLEYFDALDHWPEIASASNWDHVGDRKARAVSAI